MKRLQAGVLLLLAVPLAASADTFRFRHERGDKYHMVTEVTENVSVNGRFNNSAHILNRIAVEILEVREGSGLLRGTFQVSEKAGVGQGLFRLKEDTYTSEFWRDPLGRYRIEPRYLFPIVRDIPVFPEGPIEPGASWRASAQEVHDLREPFGVPDPVSVPLDVFYTYAGKEIRDGVEVAVLRASYSAAASLGGLRAPGGWVPVRIMGSSEQLIYFDPVRGRIHSYEDRFSYLYLLSDGQYIEYEGTSRGRVVASAPMDRARVAEDIRKSIEDYEIPDASVRVDEAGVTVTLENIQFLPDSAELLSSEKAKLDKIAEILKRYPDRDLLITGHTALAGTAEGRQELSLDRAAAVGNYLLSLGVRKPSEITVRGVGASQPLADNSTEEGRRRNRRVEIQLLEN